jgi:AcrR family transcriptional regulator
MGDRTSMSDSGASGADHESAPPDPRPVDRRRQRHEAKRAVIVAEAWDLARRDGLAAISLRDLAERVDLRQPSLYAYFDSKLALYDAMFVDGYRQLLAQLAQHEPSDDPREALVEFVAFCVRFAVDDVVRHQLLFQRTVPGFRPSPEARAVTLEFLEIGWRRLMDVGVTDVASSDIFTSIVVGLTHQQVFNDPRGDRWLRHVRRAVEMFLADVERRSGPDGELVDRSMLHPRSPRPPAPATS